MNILTSTVNGVARIQLNRPEKKNALTSAMYTAIVDALASASADEGVRAILFHGHPNFFTAGNDLEEFLNAPPEAHSDSVPNAPVLRFLHTLANTDKPVVAAVNGIAVGVGATMLMHCDLVYCASDATLSMPFVRLGLCPEFASSFLVPLHAGWHVGVEKLLLGDSISPEEALACRMVNRVLPPEEVLPYAIQQAERFNSLPPIAVRESKRLMKRAWKALVERAMADESAVFSQLLQGAEAKHAFQAFLQRRS